MRIGAVRLEAPLPDEAGARHPERSEDQPVGQLLECFPRDRFDRPLQIEVAFAGVAESIAGPEMRAQREVGIAPIREPAAMGEHLLRGDQARLRIVPDVGRKVLGK
jgi:hypothetical protein